MLRWLLLLWLLLHLLCTCLLLWRGLGLLQVPCGLLMSSGHPASQEMAQLGMGLFPARVAKASGVTRKGRSTQTRGICARNAHALFFSPIERLGAGNAGDTFRTGFKCVHHSRTAGKGGPGLFLSRPSSETISSPSGTISRIEFEDTIGIGNFCGACPWTAFLLAPGLFWFPRV